MKVTMKLAPLLWFVLFWLVYTGEDRTMAQYDPMPTKDRFIAKSVELTVKQGKQKREVPIRVDLPVEVSPAPVVFFSHGLGGSRNGNHFLGNHLASRGYVVVFLQHAGSDTSVWQDKPLRERMNAMREAASVTNLMFRCQDVQVTLDQLENWNREKNHPLYGRLDLEHVGMSGHSFGALTTQAVSGQTFPGGIHFVDKRIDAAIAYSPSSPAIGLKSRAFGSVSVPWMLMTGTKDVASIGNQTVESRLDVFPNLPRTIDRFELVLKDAEHSVFTDRSLPGESGVRNPKHHPTILALTTAFWDAYLKNDTAAKEWLRGKAVSNLIESEDRWQASFAPSN